MADDKLPPPPPDAFVSTASLPKPPADAVTPAAKPTPTPAREWPNFRTISPGEQPMTFPSPLSYMAGNVMRNPGQVLTTAAQGIPGGGPLIGAGRMVAGPAATYAAETLMGRDPTGPVAESAISSVGGAVLGGLGKAVYRVGRAGLDKAGQMTADVIGKAVPEFAGKTWQETISRVVGGEGLSALRDRYGTTLAGLFKKYGDPDLYVPALAEATGKETWMVGAASVVKDRIASVRRSIYKVSGEVPFTAQIHETLDLLHTAEQQLETGLMKVWPKEAAAVLDTLRGEYRTGMAIQKLFGAGKEKLTAAQIKKLVPSEGTVNLPDLQALLQSQRGRFLERAGQVGKDIERALMRREANPLARDIPGRGVRWGGHVSPAGGILYPKGMPRAPRLTGEGPTADDVAEALRLLGVGATRAAVAP